MWNLHLATVVASAYPGVFQDRACDGRVHQCFLCVEEEQSGVPEPTDECEAFEDEEEAAARTPKPLRDPREPTAAERAPHEATPFTIPFMCAECVAISATTRRAARFHKTRTPFWKSCRTGALSETETRSCSEKPFLSSHTGSCRQKRDGPDQNAADVAQRALNGLRSFGRCGRVHIKTDMGRLDVGAL